MKHFIFIIIIAVLSLSSQCEQPKPVILDCTKQVDSLNKYWIDVIKNLQITDTNYILDTISVIDTSVVLIEKINYVDSIRYTFIDTLIQIDTFYNSFGNLTEITIDSVKVDSLSGCGPGSNMIDDIPFIARENKGTRWCLKGYPHQAIFYFDTTYTVAEIWVNTFGWNEGYTHNINIYYYADLITSFTTAEDLYSKHKLFYTGKHLYMDVVGGKNSYTDIGEVKLFGYRKKK